MQAILGKNFLTYTLLQRKLRSRGNFILRDAPLY